jgi:hypothetical protein
MKAKSLFGIFLIFWAIGFVGCSDNDDDIDDVSLKYTALHAQAINTTYEIPITAGSGDYSVVVDDPRIADAKTEKQESDYMLVIKTKEEGDTFLTLTDNKTGKSIICSIFVNIKTNRIEITSIGYGVDADQKETILEELKRDEPFPIGSYFVIDPIPFGTGFSPGKTGQWTAYNSNGAKIAQATYVIEKTENLPSYMFELLPIEKPILTYTTLKVGELERVYHLVLVHHGTSGNQAMAYMVIYEDITDQYKAVVPDLGVKAVVRAYTYDPWNR